MKADNKKKLMALYIKGCLLKNYGNNLVLSRLKEVELNLFDVELSYNKIFHIKDELSDTLFVRSIKFDRVFDGRLKFNGELKLPLDEINSTIHSEYDSIKKGIIQKVLSEGNAVIEMIKNVHISSAFLSKFYTILNQLTIEGAMHKSMIDEFKVQNKNFHKYISLTVDEGYGELRKNGDLIATNKLKLLHKKHKRVKETVNEALLVLIQNRYDYMVYDLNIHTLKSYVNIISCLFYLRYCMKIENVQMKLQDFYKIYLKFDKKVDFNKFRERINNLAYSNVISSQNGLVSLTA